MTTELQENELRAFVDSVTHFFAHSSGDGADVRSAYLADPRSELPRFDYTGIIDVRGDWRGCLYFSAPRGMLSHLLLVTGEGTYSEEDHLDLVGEIANTFSGRARRELGEGLEISVPRRGRGMAIRASGATRPFVIPLTWRGYDAVVVVDLQIR
ncbi:MAG: chemotaxis protein CheX [Moraxellaceae bacterium]|nr:chemotaxis protein CheX [Moraxellaceae bacterium]